MAALTGFSRDAALAFAVTGLFIDGFAGGGGASTGIAQAIGREVDIALNHSESAIAIHAANHPETEHWCQDIRAAWPLSVTKMQPVAGAWFSPDCKEFSKAKGSAVKDRSIRTLAWEVPVWMEQVRPTVVYLENVEEFEDLGPLDENGKIIKELKGRDFKRWVRKCRSLGYRVQWRQLRACDYGTPTSRNRLYIIMRCDGLPIVWPKKTHGPPDSDAVRRGKLLPYRTAAECIDWSIKCPSIFGRKRDLADATLRRIAHGVMRYVVNAARPFIVDRDGRSYRVLDGAARAPHVTKFYSTGVGAPMDGAMPTVTANGGSNRGGAAPLGLAEAELAAFMSYGQQGGLNRPADKPHSTIAASRKDTNSVVGATLVGVGGRRAQSPPLPVNGPYPTTTTKADAALATAKMVEAPFIDRQFGKTAPGSIEEPLATTPTKNKSAQVTAFLSDFYGSNKRAGGGDPQRPLRTVRASGQHHAVVAAHIEQANGGPRNKNSAGTDARRPFSTVMGSGSQQRIVETVMVEEGDLPPEMLERATRVASFLVKYYATDGENETAQSQVVDRPIDTITAKARFAVVTVTIDAVTYVIVDIGMRMLTPRELARAQGFPDDYVLDPVCWYVTEPSKKYPNGNRIYGRLPKSLQISAIGNSVCPPMARALVRANQPGVNDNMPLASPRRLAA